MSPTVVVKGLLIDSSSIPITYELFPGNTMDQNTLKEMYHLKGITVVTDRGMNSNDSLLFLHGGGYHFVVSYTLKRSRQEFRDAVFNERPPPWEMKQYNSKTGQLNNASKVLKQRVSAKIELTTEGIVVLNAQRK